MGTSYLELINQWGWNNYLRRKKSPYAPTSHQTEEINPLEMKTKRIKANFKTHQRKSRRKIVGSPGNQSWRLRVGQTEPGECSEGHRSLESVLGVTGQQYSWAR